MPNPIYSEVTVKTVKPFRMARYVMITPNPEDDVIGYMMMWAERSGLLKAYPSAKKIGWDFPFVPKELEEKFGLRGYVSAYILPDGFTPECGGVEIAQQLETTYATVTITDPFSDPFGRIPRAYGIVLDFLKKGAYREDKRENVLPCFEYTYEKDGVTYMDVCLNAVAPEKGYNTDD